MFNPVSTYRIQFHRGFTFKDFEQIIPYLGKLGVKTIYASPIFEAVPGSVHGYDVTNPLNINTEIGTRYQLESISKQLKKLDIAWLQDIVPNHMAFHPDNQWLMDVLAKGKRSAYAGFFDISWDALPYNGQLMAPFLGKTWDEAINDKEIKIRWLNDRLVFDYFDQHYPLNVSAYGILLKLAGGDHNQTIARIRELLFTSDQIKYNEGIGQFFGDYTKLLKRHLTNAFLNKINRDPVALNQVADEQYYRLSHWQETDWQINYRRFFTVNGLISLNMQNPAVFEAYHTLAKELLQAGIFQGLRVDHIDGLFDPTAYLERLRTMAGPDAYIIVEKILEPGEQFPSEWPVEGNTGYDVLAALNNLFTFHPNRHQFTSFYKSLDSPGVSVKRSIVAKKRMILYDFMSGDLDNLLLLFMETQSRKKEHLVQLNTPHIREAIGEVLVQCPVYRFYGNKLPINKGEATHLRHIFQKVSAEKPQLQTALALLSETLLAEKFLHKSPVLRFYMRLMQFTGPVMAKGVEDTLMYSYNRFIDHNEVGDAPDAFGMSADKFHEEMVARQRLWPLSMNTTSTHDTKRGEDVRARLNVLSDLAAEWIGLVERWQKLSRGNGKEYPVTLNDEYFIYQTIAGALPMPGTEDNFPERLQEYLIKALREGKERSNWSTPDENYENSTKEFATGLLKKDSNFLKSFEPFLSKLADFGIINSLAQVLLKYTCPGVPDMYQGCELWDLSLVDPDNRRPVDYQKREQFLVDGQPDWEQLWQGRYNGQIKLALISMLLNERKNSSEAFAQGEYIPLTINGKLKDHVLAFARHHKNNWYLMAVPLHLATIAESEDPIKVDWADTRIILPDGAPSSWRNLLTREDGFSEKSIPADSLFNQLPVALLSLYGPKNGRSAGILMHITSLPGRFPIGDLGPQAFKFVDYLFNAKQHYWQLLPVNPVTRAAGYSPYSASSAMAGNTLLISPEKLFADGLLSAEELKHPPIADERVDFAKAIAFKNKIFARAYLQFIESDIVAGKKEFETFKKKEAYWLDDFANYEALKLKFEGKAWYDWPANFKRRESGALLQLETEYPAAIDQIKWLQFVFAAQWAELKTYCEEKQITLLGDMPFYASYDSVDVWANPDFFKLDDEGNRLGMAGVPPDYFSAEGQLWGMPVYRWDNLKARHYGWWIKRIRKNLQYFDLLRLDHFRAFAAYWEVPGGSRNAINGKWMPGPGAEFFDILKKELGTLPFVAEDLGEIDEPVYSLRDQFKLPGMRVLQFAFDETAPVSDHIPHNYVTNCFAYTGTHDNNTARGWYHEDADRGSKDRFKGYSGRKITPGNISEEMIRLCYASVAKTVIIPMQDVLGLDGAARMNVPSSAKGNWTWRMEENAASDAKNKLLQKLVNEYNR